MAVITPPRSTTYQPQSTPSPSAHGYSGSGRRVADYSARSRAHMDGGPRVVSELAIGAPHVARGLAQWEQVVERQTAETQQMEAIKEIEGFQDAERLELARISQLGGQAAAAGPEMMQKFYAESGGKLEEKARGDFQRRIFQDAVSRSRDQGLNKAVTHQVQQHEIYKDEFFTGQVDRFSRETALNPDSYLENAARIKAIDRELNPDREPGLQAALDLQRDEGQLANAIDAELNAGNVDRAEELLRGSENILAPTVAGARFSLPTDNHHFITSAYGPRQAPNTPKGRGSSNHQGIDLRMPVGTPVKAVASGTIKFAGDKGGYGVAVIIEHDDGTTTSQYGHLDSFSVKPGMKVKAGEVIALSGNTGKSTGPHLDLKITENGQYINAATALGLENVRGGKKLGPVESNPKFMAEQQRKIDAARVRQGKEYSVMAKTVPNLAKDEMIMIQDTGVDNPEVGPQVAFLESVGALPAGSVEAYEKDKRLAFETNRWISDPINLAMSIPDQIAKARAELTPDPEKDKGEWEAKRNYVNSVVSTLEKQLTALNTDPMAVVAGQAEKVVQKEIETGLLKADDKAAVFKARVEVSRQLAVQMGMGAAGLEKFPLSAGQVKGIGEQLAAAGNAQQRIGLLNQYYDEFGDYSEAAFKQLGVDYSELLSVEAAKSGDPWLMRAAQLSVNRPEKLTRIKKDDLDLLVNDVVAATDFGEILDGRISNSYGLDPDALQKRDGLVDFAYGVAASMIESGHSESQARKEVKAALEAMTAGKVALNEDYANIYLTVDKDGKAADKTSVLAGLKALSSNFGDDFYWVNDGDEYFALVSRVSGLAETFDETRAVRVSRADAAYVGGLRGGFTVDVAEVNVRGQYNRSKSASFAAADMQRRAAEVVARMKKEPPSDDHGRFIEAVRANTVKEIEAKGRRKPAEALPGSGVDDDFYGYPLPQDSLPAGAVVAEADGGVM